MIKLRYGLGGLRRCCAAFILGQFAMVMLSSAAHADHTSALTEEAKAADALGRKALIDYEMTYSRQDRYTKTAFDDDVTVTLLDGTKLSADIFRPDAPGRFPVIVSMTPYQKNMPWPVPPDHEAEQGVHQVWELPNPDRWVPKGYVIVRVDARGTGMSDGTADLGSLQEAKDFAEIIEWAAKQPWSNGKIGLSGISYMGMNQWQVAGLQPPSLKAIFPWEGLADQYRDAWFKGGILSTAYMSEWLLEFYRDASLRGWKTASTYETYKRNTFWDIMYHGLDGDYWQARRPDWSKVTVPLYSAGNWGGWKGAGHLRGNLEGFKLAASKHKRLRVHTGDHQDAYYSEEGYLEQLRFFDFWLAGVKNGLDKDPPVKLAVRHGMGRFDFTWRNEMEWPLARTQYKKFFLTGDPSTPSGTFASAIAPVQSTRAYDSPGILLADNKKVPGFQASFVTEPFSEDVEITGEILLNLWLASTEDDAFPHVTLLRVTEEGEDVVTLGRLRASQRKLDPALSTVSRPYHEHRTQELLQRNVPVELQIEIWPTSMIFPKGSRLKLIIAGDSRDSKMGTYIAYRKAKPATETIYMGGQYDSYLQLPIIPARK